MYIHHHQALAQQSYTCIFLSTLTVVRAAGNKSVCTKKEGGTTSNDRGKVLQTPNFGILHLNFNYCWGKGVIILNAVLPLVQMLGLVIHLKYMQAYMSRISFVYGAAIIPDTSLRQRLVKVNIYSIFRQTDHHNLLYSWSCFYSFIDSIFNTSFLQTLSRKKINIAPSQAADYQDQKSSCRC